MKVIIVEDVVYKVTDKEYKKLRAMADGIRDAKYPECEKLSDDLNLYLDENKANYNEVGVIMFDYRI